MDKTETTQDMESDITPVLKGSKPLELNDIEVVTQYLRLEQPQISEMTFTNLFMWRRYYRPYWLIKNDNLIIVCWPPNGIPFGLPPAGPGDKTTAVEYLMDGLAPYGPEAGIRRADIEFVERFIDRERFQVTLEPGQSDYVYLTRDLINLSGRKLHQKKNHLNRFIKNNQFEIRELDISLIEDVLGMQEAWCRLRECRSDPGLSGEDRAVYEALSHFNELDYRGLAILVGSKVEAFSLGEPLNHDTAVVHMEKANPAFRGLYAAINQRFCQELFSAFRYINREQDLGVEGLRRAKESYQPHHMVEKYIVVPRRA